MPKWFCKVENIAIIEADTEEHARELFEREFDRAPQDVHVVDDDEPADLEWHWWEKENTDAARRRP